MQQSDGQHDDEQIILVFRRHIIAMRKGFYLLLIPFVIASLPSLIWPGELTWLYVAFGGLAFGGILFFYHWIGWYFTVFIITDQRLRQTSQTGLFGKSVIDLDISKIQNISYNIPGFTAEIFDFGTIIVQTYVGDLILDKIHHPGEVYNTLQKAVKNTSDHEEEAKKLKDKILRKQQVDERPTRITNETVAEHRERILAGGRRFKYPVQVAKHRLAVISIAIGVLAVLLLIVIAWYQLYIAQNTSKLIYRVTELVPVSVATVDGTDVRYSSYLKKYRSSVYYLQQQNSINLRSADGQRQSNHIKGRELDSAERDAYAMKIAAQKRIAVTNKEVDDFINRDIARKNISLEAYEKTVLNSFYDWSLSDYRAVVRTELLKRKVRFAVDTDARRKAESIVGQAARGTNFADLARSQSDDEPTKPNGGEVGTVTIDNDDPSGVIAAARALQPNQVSDPIQGADGYFVIKLTSKTDTSVTYSQIKVNLRKFEENFKKLREDGKIKEHIEVKRD